MYCNYSISRVSSHSKTGALGVDVIAFRSNSNPKHSTTPLERPYPALSRCLLPLPKKPIHLRPSNSLASFPFRIYSHSNSRTPSFSSSSPPPNDTSSSYRDSSYFRPSPPSLFSSSGLTPWDVEKGDDYESSFVPQLRKKPKTTGAMPDLLFKFDDKNNQLNLPTESELMARESLLSKSSSTLLPPLQSMSLKDFTSAATPPNSGGGGGNAGGGGGDGLGSAVAATATKQQEEIFGTTISHSITTTPSFTSQSASFESLLPTEEGVDVSNGLTEGTSKTVEDGMGQLADGSWYEKLSGIDRTGEFGFEKKWTLIRGRSADKRLVWEECWWEASDRRGFRELGAVKSGSDAATGAAWRETWTEKLGPRLDRPEHLFIERSAHKWARQDRDGKEQWEEKWNEAYDEAGGVNKTADKWARSQNDVWHERWGEDYDTSRGWCRKWTDKWAERLSPSSGKAVEQWGDKWMEDFCDGKGEKHGEAWTVTRRDEWEGGGGGGLGVGDGGDDRDWRKEGEKVEEEKGKEEKGKEDLENKTVDANGEDQRENPITQEYHRWWNEGHFGGGNVRKWGESTAGEHWDVHEQNAETYYNPVPHFGFHLALAHSPKLREVPLPAPKESGGYSAESESSSNGKKKKAAKKKNKTASKLYVKNGGGKEQERGVEQERGTMQKHGTEHVRQKATKPDADQESKLSSSSGDAVEGYGSMKDQEGVKDDWRKKSDQFKDILNRSSQGRGVDSSSRDVNNSNIATSTTLTTNSNPIKNGFKSPSATTTPTPMMGGTIPKPVSSASLTSPLLSSSPSSSAFIPPSSASKKVDPKSIKSLDMLFSGGAQSQQAGSQNNLSQGDSRQRLSTTRPVINHEASPSISLNNSSQLDKSGLERDLEKKNAVWQTLQFQSDLQGRREEGRSGSDRSRDMEEGGGVNNKEKEKEGEEEDNEEEEDEEEEEEDGLGVGLGRL